MSEAVLKTRIEQDKLSGVFLFFGEEEYLSRHYLKEIKDKVLDAGTEQMNFIRLDEVRDLDKIIEAVETYPIFAERKLVLVKNTGFFGISKKEIKDEKVSKGKEDKNAKSKDDGKQQLIDFLKDIPDYCCVIFVEESVAKNTKTYKALASSGLAVEFTRLNDDALARWIANGFKVEGKKITSAATNSLILMCTDSLDELNNEIMKLCNLVGDRAEVNEEDVLAITSTTIKTAIFEITKALASSDTNKAFTVLDNLMQLNEPVQRLFIMVSKRFGQYLLLKEQLADGMKEDEALVKAGFGINQKRYVLSEARPFTVTYLRSFVRECHKLDLDIKKGRLTDRMAMELLIARFSKK